MQKIRVDLSALSTQVSRDTNSNRIETGVLQFNDDWPGVFIRGDNAINYAIHLGALLELDNTHSISKSVLKSLVDLLSSCAIVHNEDDDTGVGY